jgi:hypothetical protein
LAGVVGYDGAEDRVVREEFFFFKKSSKELLPVGASLAGSARKGIKVFCFFFSKKKAFLSS